MRRFWRTILVIVLAALGGLTFLAFPQPGTSGARRGAIDKSKVIDLTYTFDASTIYWPTAKSFEWQKESWGLSPGGYWYAAARYLTLQVTFRVPRL